MEPYYAAIVYLPGLHEATLRLHTNGLGSIPLLGNEEKYEMY
jgi:hypothetical protein